MASFDESIIRELSEMNYQIVKRIGNGQFGCVFQVMLVLTQEQYAMKTLSMALMCNDPVQKKKVIQDLLRETEVMKLFVGTRNIVSYHAHFHINDTYVLIMELCSGGNLRDYLNKHHTVDQSVIESFSHQICSGLYHLHSKDVIHRDLKPENLLLTADQITVKIADFGFSCRLEFGASALSMSSTAGTLNYLPPEVLDHESGNSKQGDIWSFGVIILELCFGKIPFKTSELLTLNNQSIDSIFKNTIYNEQLVDFISSCLIVEKSKRIKIEKLLSHPFINKSSSQTFNLSKNMEHLLSEPIFDCIKRDKKMYTEIMNCCSIQKNNVLDIYSGSYLHDYYPNDRGYYLGDKDKSYIECFGQCLGLITILNELNLARCELYTHIIQLSPYIKQLVLLKTLNLSFNRIEGNIFCQIKSDLLSLTNLECLNIGNNNLGNLGITSLCEILSVTKKLNSLYLFNTGISKSEMKDLCNSIQFLTSLKTLILSDNPISSEGAEYLSNVSKELKSLKTLGLSSTQIGYRGLLSLDMSIGKMRFNKLTYSDVLFDLPKKNLFSDFLYYFNNLQEVNFSERTLILDQIVYFSETLFYLTNLKILNLSRINLQAISIKYLAQSLVNLNKLTLLDLRDNDIRADGFKYISSSIKYLTNLKTLNLSNNFLHEMSRGDLTYDFCCPMVCFQVRNWHYQSDFSTFIANLKYLPVLTRVDLSNNDLRFQILKLRFKYRDIDFTSTLE